MTNPSVVSESLTREQREEIVKVAKGCLIFSISSCDIDHDTQERLVRVFNADLLSQLIPLNPLSNEEKQWEEQDKRHEILEDNREAENVSEED